MMKKLLLVFACITAVTFVNAQDAKMMYDSGLKYYQNGEYDKAEKMFIKVYNKKGDYLDCAKKLKSCREKLEYAMFGKCKTVQSCNEYLNKYPNGKYVDQVRGIKATLTAPRKPDAKNYVKINNMYFGNVDEYYNIINDYGSYMYASEVMYLSPKINYTCTSSSPEDVTVYCKIFDPNGTMMSTSNSPRGFTYSFDMYPEEGTWYIVAGGWGSYNTGVYRPGKYRFELWSQTTKLYETSFTLDEKKTPLQIGDWKNALRKCHGSYTFKSDDDIYKGQVTNNIPSGIGMYVWPNMYYIGNWISGYMDGMGISFFSANNSTNAIKYCPRCAYYVGNWSSDKKSGTGTCYDEYGNLIYYGNFTGDKPTGTYPMVGYNKYKFECIEFEDSYYVGETRGGYPHGIGFWVDYYGNMWYGQWSYGSKEYGVSVPYSGAIRVEKYDVN